MATTNLNPYGNGGGILNSTPYMQYFLQTRAHEEAKKAALENHFNKLNESINPAGVRNQDVDGFMRRVNENREFYNQNKKAIQNPTVDNGKAYSEYMSRHQAALGYVNQSKQAADLSKQAAPLFMNVQTRERLAPKTFDDYQAHDLPLDNPNRKQFDLAAIQIDPKPFDLAARTQYLNNGFKHIPLTETFVGSTRDPKTLQIINTTSKGYDKGGAVAIVDKAKSDWYADPSIHKFVNDAYADPAAEGAAHGRLNGLFKQYTGKDISDKGDLWAATVLEQKMHEVRDQKVAPDWLGRNAITNAQQIAHQNRGFDLAKRLANYKKGLSASGNGSGVVDVAAEKINRLYDAGTDRQLTVDGKPYEGKTIQPPPQIVGKYAQSHPDPKDPSGKVLQDPYEFVLTKDRKYVIPVFRNGEPNKATGKAPITTKTDELIPIERFYDDMQMHYATKSQLGKLIDSDGEDLMTDETPSVPRASRAKRSTSSGNSKKKSASQYGL